MTIEYIQQSDIHVLETADGQVLVLPSEEYAMVSYGDFGSPPVTFVTRRGFMQTGETLLDYALGRRSISLEIHREAGENRPQYWAFRAELQDFLRHNRGGSLTYTLIQPGDVQRSLIVRPDPGFTFPPSPDNWGIQEPLRFVAFDPIWFDPTDAGLTLTGSAGTDLVFPITFPIIFGPSGVNFTTGTITYPGTWRSCPTITLTGPYDWVSIQNTATNVTIGLSVPVGAGQTRVITLEPGNLSVVDGSGANKFAELSPGSDLINFNIRPDPEVPDGQQAITVQMQNGSLGVSGAAISYKNRYVGI